MAKAAPETIILKGDPIMKELEAGGTITPGHMVERESDGTIEVHDTAGTAALACFAKENDIAGDDLTHDYLINEKVLFFVGRSGDEVLAILADGENAVIGSFLESNGDGQLRVVEVDSSAATIIIGSIVAQSIVTLDLSATGFALAARRIQIEIK